MKLPRLKLMFHDLYRNILAVFTLTGLLVLPVAITTVASASRNVVPPGEASAASALSSASRDELTIQLGENGFTPSEVQHPAGTFAIAVENLVLASEYTLRVKAHDGTVVKEVQVQQGSTAWTITLSAGEYTLTEANHAQWLCRITVQ